jgi:hypothetical protein
MPAARLAQQSSKSAQIQFKNQGLESGDLENAGFTVLILPCDKKVPVQ